MRYCNGCGDKMIIESTFCPSCGFKQLKTTSSTAQTDSDVKVKNKPSFENVQPEDINSEIESSSKSNLYGFIALIGGLVITAWLIVYNVDKSKNNKSIVLASDTVAVDTVSSTQQIESTSKIMIDSTAAIVSNETPAISSESNSSNNFTGEDFARQKFAEITDAVNQGDYDKFYEIFEESIVFHKLSNATIPQIVKEVKNYKKRWQIVDENYLAVNFIMTDRGGMDVYEYEKTIQLERVPNNGKIYKYHITGRAIINSSSGKINYLVDEKTIKEN